MQKSAYAAAAEFADHMEHAGSGELCLVDVSDIYGHWDGRSKMVNVSLSGTEFDGTEVYALAFDPDGAVAVVACPLEECVPTSSYELVDAICGLCTGQSSFFTFRRELDSVFVRADIDYTKVDANTLVWCVFQMHQEIARMKSALLTLIG